MVGITGRLVHADGQEDVLVVGGEVWGEWTGQVVEGADWEKGAKDEWEAKERAVNYTRKLAQERGINRRG